MLSRTAFKPRVPQWAQRDPDRVRTTHDYTRATWGHALTFMQVEPDGRKANVLGFGATVREGDYLLVANGPGETTRFRIAKLKWLRPSDHWKAEIEFAPRQEGSC